MSIIITYKGLRQPIAPQLQQKAIVQSSPSPRPKKWSAPLSPQVTHTTSFFQTEEENHKKPTGEKSNGQEKLDAPTSTTH